MIIAHYLIMQELKAPEGEQLIKWLSTFKMATKKWGIFILLVLVPVLSAKSRVPQKVNEAVQDGQRSPHPDALNAIEGYWGRELAFRRVDCLLKSNSTFELQLKIKEDSVTQVIQEGSRCWPSEQYGSPLTFKDLLVQNFKENISGALCPLVWMQCAGDRPWFYPMLGKDPAASAPAVVDLCKTLTQSAKSSNN